MRRILFFVLLGILILHFVFRVALYWGRYTENLSGEFWEERYLKSQWVIPNSQQGIGDDGLYAYHGWELVRGGDPTVINPEVPPLGKYLIGIFVHIFENNNLFGLVTGVVFLVTFFLLNVSVFKDRLLAIIPVTLISLEPLFYEQLQASFLDLLHVSMLFLTFTFFFRKQYIVSMLFLGFFTAVKFSLLAPFVVAAFLVYLFIQQDRSELKRFLPTLLVPVVILLLSYLRYFLSGNSLIDFLGVQKFIVTFYSTGVKPPVVAMILPMVFLNEWHTWWGGVQRISEWTLLWPLSFIGGLLSLKYLDYRSPFFLFLLWCGLYLIFLLITPVWPRYLLLILPFLYNLSIWALSKNTKVRSYFRFLS